MISVKKQIIDELDKYIEEVERQRLTGLYPNSEIKGKRTAINHIEYLVDQLDEPEVLPQKLPVIPQFVAEYLDFAKSDVPLMRVLELASTRKEWPKWEKEYDWISANDEKFARAWLGGYEVGEQKYYVLNFNGLAILRRNTDRKYDSTIAYAEGGRFMKNIVALNEEHLYQFTEQEIKDYDERYIPFAVKVEELE